MKALVNYLEFRRSTVPGLDFAVIASFNDDQQHKCVLPLPL